MQYTFQIIRHDGDRHDGDSYTIYRQPAARVLLCKELPLHEAREALAEDWHDPIEQLPAFDQGGIYTAYRPVRSVLDLIQ